jgi:hypothetical protein
MVNKGQETLSEFMQEFKSQNSLKKDVLIKLSSFESLNSKETQFNETITDENQISQINTRFDFIFGDLPFGKKRVSSKLMGSKKINGNWNTIFESLKLISESGYGFYMVEPSITSSKIGKYFIKKLETKGFYLNLVLNVPEKIYVPQSAFSPILIGITRRKAAKLFVAELERENIHSILRNYKENTGQNILNGIRLKKSEFESFYRFKILKQIENLKTQYKEYKEYQLSEISKSINLTREEFSDKLNSIYIPRIGTSSVVASLNETQIKHQNYFQIELKENIVLAEYLAIFYKSELGQLILNSLQTGNVISNIREC